MTINRAFVLPALVLFALSACDGAVPRADERQPSHPAPPPPLPLPPRAPPAARPPALPPAPQIDWRDVPLPAGNWVWTANAGGSAARFGLAGAEPVAMLVCERAAAVVWIALPTQIAPPPTPAPRAATITASTSSATLSAEPRVIDGLNTWAIGVPVANHLLDAIAFSRGRFRIEIAGLAGAVVPSWSEPGRVVEDCRP